MTPKQSKSHVRTSPQASERMDDSSSSSSSSSQGRKRVSSTKPRKSNSGSDGSGAWHEAAKPHKSSFLKSMKSRRSEWSTAQEKQTSKKNESSSTSSDESDSTDEIQLVKINNDKQQNSTGAMGTLKQTNTNTNKSIAKSKAQKAKIPPITSPSQLKWYKTRKRQGDGWVFIIKPCRVLSFGEADRIIKKSHLNTLRGDAVVQFLSISNKNEYDRVDDNSLFPFHGEDVTTVDVACLAQYVRQQSRDSTWEDVEAERLFLARVFRHAVRIENELKDRANRDLQDYYDDNESTTKNTFASPKKRCDVQLKDSSDDEVDVLDTPRPIFELEEDTMKESVDEEFLDAPYTQAINFDPDLNNLDDTVSNEPIRPGDVIEYYSPVFVVGDKRGLRQATVLSVAPEAEVILTLSNGECLPEDTRVKRTKVTDGNELVDHPGIYRAINNFKLVAAKIKGANNPSGMMNEAARFGDIFRNNVNKMQASAEAEGFAPMDMIMCMNGGRKADKRNVSVKFASPKKSPKPIQRTTESPSSSSSEHSGKNALQFPIMSSKESLCSPESPLISSKMDRGGNLKSDPSLYSSSSDDSVDRTDTSNQISREKCAYQVATIKTPEKHDSTMHGNPNNKENVNNSCSGSKRIHRAASSPTSLGSSLASSPDSSRSGKKSKHFTARPSSPAASLGASLASSPASLGSSLALSSSSDESVSNSLSKCRQVDIEHSSIQNMPSSNQSRVGSETLDLSGDLSSESSSEGSSKKFRRKKSSHSDDDISDSDDDDIPYSKDKQKCANSWLKANRKSRCLDQSQSSLPEIGTAGWTQGKGGWVKVKAADSSSMSLSFSRHK